MKIGEVARQASIGVHAVRFYEREGLIASPPRQPSGYRDYPPDVVPRLRFVRRAKGLGFSLREVSELLELDGSSDASAVRVKRVAEARLADIEGRIGALQRMRRELKRAVAGCSGRGSTTECSILRSLSEDKP